MTRVVGSGTGRVRAIAAGWGAALALLAVGAVPVGTRAADRGRPNFVVIVADDLGYGDLSSYGGRISTPAIDALAAAGVRFTDFHANGAMCSPTRAAFLTGRYQQRSGIEQALDVTPGTGLRPQPTLASRLREAGYATGAFGKWHLGADPGMRAPDHGFDEFIGLLTGDGDYHSRIDRPGRPDWWRGTEPWTEEGYTTELITRHAISFLERHRDRPFFLYVPHLAVHFPWQGPNDPADRVAGVDYRPGVAKFGTRSDKRAAFVEMVHALDHSVGRIRARLRELELERNTLVVFFSDNGGYTVDRGGYVGVSSNGILRGQKGDMYEGGHRVPGLASWPGRIPAGVTSDATAMSMDWLPTLLELAGASPAREPWASDGMSLVGHLTSGVGLPGRQLFWRQNERKAVREGPWKLVVAPSGTELYDLSADPGEKRDRAGGELARVAALSAALARWEQDVEQSRRALVGGGVRR